MRSDIWQDIETWFKQALDRPPEMRMAFLEHHCPDADIAEEVLRLLQADDMAGAFLEEVVSDGFRNLKDAEEDAYIGTYIGPYQVLELLGRGGVSSVYLVRRDDGELRKTFALKLVRRGMDTEDILNRFRHERQILASLDHPNIARFFDGGTTADGVPYFVMEHIDGTPITTYCDSHRLTVRQRLKLFDQICAAVSLAHRNLVVHRDLKPSNILVTAEGVPKLLDFGIAKLLNPDFFLNTIALTRKAEAMMTPGYASPEQVSGGQVTTASDIYALGVLLYELLAGKRPFSEVSDWVSLQKHILQQIPPLPSQQVATGYEDFSPEDLAKARGGQSQQLVRELRGDLDTIVLLALRKEPERRYSSAEHFAQDLRRHLAGHPVLARRDTFSYRASKFLRRHRWGVAGACLAFLVAMVFMIAIFTQSRAIRLERDRVVHERDRATRALNLLQDMFSITNPEQAAGEAITAMELLDRGAARVVELEDVPDTASLLETLAKLYEELNLYPKAFPLRERVLRIHQQTHGPLSEPMANAYNALGINLAYRGDYARAANFFLESTRVWREVANPPYPRLSDSLSNLGLIQQDLGNYAKALEYYQEGFAIEQIGIKSDLDRAKSFLVENFALLYQDLGDYQQAEQMYRAQLAIRKKVLPADHLLVRYSESTLGEVLYAKGAFAEAEGHLMAALKGYASQKGEPPADLARVQTQYGRLLCAQNRLEEAFPYLEAALKQREEQLGKKHLQYAASLVAMAEYRWLVGAAAAAEQLALEALEIYQASQLEGHPEMVDKLLLLARILQAQNRHAEALPHLQKALTIREKALPQGNWKILEAEIALSMTQFALTQDTTHKKRAVQNTQILGQVLGLDHPIVRRFKAQLASY